MPGTRPLSEAALAFFTILVGLLNFHRYGFSRQPRVLLLFWDLQIQLKFHQSPMSRHTASHGTAP